MKRLAIIGVLLAAACSPAFAAKTWQGDLFVTAVTPACESDGIAVNSFYRSVLEPQNYGGGAPATHFILVSPTSAQYYKLNANSSFQGGQGGYKGVSINSTSVLKEWVGQFSNASRKPQLISFGTRNLAIRITINDFAGIAGCTAALAGSIGDRPF
jgi:hypothetical protein